MFHLHYDTDLERLADDLAMRLATRDPAQLLVPQTVLIPQRGMQRWLVQRLAEQHGIAANLEFMAPAQMAWRMLRAAHPELPRRSAFDREALRWRLLEWLPVQAADDPRLAALLEAEPPALRRFLLASHFARLFERYQGYRRDMLDAWASGADADNSQARLWRALVAGCDEPPRGTLLADFLRRFGADGAPPPPELPARLFAFGCINVSPDVLRLLGVLGRHGELHFYLPSPCREYWGDVPSRREQRERLLLEGGGVFDAPDNPLLVSMGGVGRDFMAQVFGFDELQADIDNAPGGDDAPRDTLLHRVQADVIELQAPGDAKSARVDADDVSLRVHVCHSPLREVQVLHDHLLDLLQRDPTLEARDIAVMVPDIASYAPCVDAVFGALAEGDPRRIPWTLADLPASGAHAIVTLFEHLLNLPTTRLELDDVLQVLAIPAVARAAGLGDEDVRRAREWAVAAGIRWGADEHDRAALGLPPYREFSWRFGRERLLLGYMLGDDEAPDAAPDADDGELVEGIAPLTDIEGQRAAALGQLLRVERQLQRLRAAQRTPRSPRQWQRLLNATLSELLPDAALEPDEQRALVALRKALAALADQSEAGGFAGELDWMSVRAFLREQLADTPVAQRFLAGGVSVCSMVPLRNVPFRVICILGLDAPSFPRRDLADALDRMYGEALAGKRKLGDRSNREDDRYLFLQTIMAARDVLYLSYTGIDARNGSQREPSILLDELLDVVAHGYFVDHEKARRDLVTTHPMQPFARVLFDGDNPHVFTFRGEWRAAAQVPQARALVEPFADTEWPPEDHDAHVTLAELRDFFHAPQRAFLRRQMGVALESQVDDTPERAALVADSRARAALDRTLVRAMVAADEIDAAALRTRLRAQAMLPPLAIGDALYDEVAAGIAPQAAAWRRWREDRPMRSEHFALALPSGRVLEGVLEGLDEGGYSGWVGRANSGQRWFRWWLGALVARALHGAIACAAFGHSDKPHIMPLVANMPDTDRAKAILDDVLDAREAGLREPLPWPPRSAWAYAAVVASGKPVEDAIKAARKVWSGDGERYEGEQTDVWMATALRGAAPFEVATQTARFKRLTRTLYEPLWDALKSGRRP